MTTHTKSTRKPRPFRLHHPFRDPLRKTLMAATRPAIERVLRFPDLNDMHNRLATQNDDRPYVDKILDDMAINIDVPDEMIERIPKQGPLIVVANHPFGGLEGIILASLLRKRRDDVRLLANYLLEIIPNLQNEFIFVDPFGRGESVARNLASMRTAVRWVKHGGVLGIFPAGEVSHFTLKSRTVTDPQWSDTVAKLIERTQAPVLPISFAGRNSTLFQLAGMVHPALRTMLLPHETLKKRKKTVNVKVGNVIPFEKISKLSSPTAISAYLRVRTYILKDDKDVARGPRMTTAPGAVDHQPIIVAVSPALMAEEVAALPVDRALGENGDLQVFHARASEIPNLLREIGRLREQTFRLVGEGTGKACDLDRFDDDYIHLFVWHKTKAEVVGAYRMGPTDEILKRYGKHGLYCSSLFHFKRQLMEQINPALELGRSFVAPAYQREFGPLMLLWKGIGGYACKFPRYRYLIGPVSISNDYKSNSKQLLMAFLNMNRYLPSLAKFIRPKNPPRESPPRDCDYRAFSTVVRDVAEVNDLLREIETDQKTMPVLLRQYLKLNAKLLGFNVDPDFGGVLDGLMLLDLCDVERGVLNRYMGKENATTFLKYHGFDA